MLGSDDLLALQVSNIAYNTYVIPIEIHRVQLSGCYLLLSYTGARPAEIVEKEENQPKDGCWEELFRPQYDARQEDQSELQRLLYQINRRKCTMALCYEDISLMVVRNPDTGIERS